MLNPRLNKRFNLSQIENHPWTHSMRQSKPMQINANKQSIEELSEIRPCSPIDNILITDNSESRIYIPVRVKLKKKKSFMTSCKVSEIEQTIQRINSRNKENNKSMTSGSKTVASTGRFSKRLQINTKPVICKRRSSGDYIEKFEPKFSPPINYSTM